MSLLRLRELVPGATSHEWVIASTVIWNTPVYTRTFGMPGFYTYSYVASNAGCADTADVTVEVLSAPTISGITPFPTDICLGDAISLNVMTSGATSEEWYENGTLVGTGSSYTTTPAISGSYT